ncbi:aromatic-ring-hydroxylating dioxygenase subunit beta [Chachezhania sediminis]|uniref:aromatic-ring-hydroxylating dioxygenase subunit beta n=1 Tax=Chachezhania sediminis TaxID=2599291 RepID=UPI00131E230B|nr:aromatic-ring-hydroxylating dioxygenase subunit beta [Chachezhania sediminis]
MNIAEMEPPVSVISTLPVDERLRLTFLVEEFNSLYAEVLDAGRIADWPDFFTEDGVYRLLARDNAEAGLPLSLMYCNGRGMLKDRAYAIENTEMFGPRYSKHQVTNTRILGLEGNILSARSNYVIFETHVDEPTRILQVGSYHDRFALDGETLLLKERCALYDTVCVPVSVVFPP